MADLYNILFGKEHIKDGSVVEMAEHGRQGGISDGQPFKHVGFVTHKILQATNASLSFIGIAKPGTNATLPNWRIMAVTRTGDLIHADGNDNFDNIWDSRETYVYS